MQVGLSCLVIPGDWKLTDILSKTKAAGYEALELVLRDEGEITLSTPDATLGSLAAQAKDAGMYLASVCPSLPVSAPNLTHADPAYRAKSIDTWKAIIDKVAAMGIGTVLVVPGGVTEEVAYDEAYDRARDGLAALGPYADAANVNLAIEYVWNKFLLSPLEFARFCDEVGSKRVGFYFDPGNMAIFGYPEQWLRINARHLMKVHMKDFKRDGWEWVPLLGGSVDFPAIMALLREIGYDDALLSEIDTGLASLEDSAATIRKIMAM
jgi:hexulose-6-phosphate isomerase